jgi:hypothetical protein
MLAAAANTGAAHAHQGARAVEVVAIECVL